MKATIQRHREDLDAAEKMPVSKGCIPKKIDLERWPHLKDIKIPELADGEVLLLIGLKERPRLFLPLEVREGGDEFMRYDIIRSDRNRYGGGVAIYIRTIIPYIIRKDLLQDTLELLCIEVRKPKSKPVLISTWYRPPSAKIELFQKFENFLKLIDNEDKDIIITGDLNCNFIEHTQNHATSQPRSQDLSSGKERPWSELVTWLTEN